MFSITPIYASLLVLLIIFLAYRVTGFRRSEAISLGEETGTGAMKRAIRVHANAVENVPLALILLLLLELNQVTPWILHLFGCVLLLGRILHAWGLSQRNGPSFGRFYGTVLTWLGMAAMSVTNLLVILTG